MDLGLKGKVAIITGASGGIGSGCARVFAQEGANLVLNYFTNPDNAKNLAQELMEEYGVRAIAVHADVADADSLRGLFDAAMKEFGTVDILINNAGAVGRKYPARVPIEDFPLNNFREREAIIVESLFVGCQAFVKILREQKKGGHIINVLSKTAFWSSTSGNTMYATCKGASSAFTQALAHELAYENIYVNAIIPGYVSNYRTNTESSRYKETVDKIPMGRYATPEEMGYVAAFLCSDKACQINGARIDCTGATMNGDVIPRSVLESGSYTPEWSNDKQNLT